MGSKTVQSRVDENLKKQADNLYKTMGMSTADAIRIFLQQSVNIGGLPFQPMAKKPNTETLKAIDEVENGKAQRYKNTNEMYEDLEI